MSANWPFAPIQSTVVLSNVGDSLSSEGYEFGGYLFYAEEMVAHSQFAGTKLDRMGSQPLLGVSYGNQSSTSQTCNSTSQSKLSRPQGTGRVIAPKPSSGTTPFIQKPQR
jgi:hypothetical protein